MATATINDLFTPINAIKACMESKGDAITSLLSNINENVMGTARGFNAAFKPMAEKIVESNESVARGLGVLGNALVGGVSGASSGGLGAGIDVMTKTLSDIRTTVNLIAMKSIKGGGGVASKVADAGLKSAGLPDMAKLKDLFDVVKTSSKIRLKVCEAFGKKIGKLIEGITEPMKDPQTRQALTIGIGQLGKAGESIKEFAKSMAESIVFVPFAMVAIGGLNKVLPKLKETVENFYGKRKPEEMATRIMTFGRMLKELGGDVLSFEAKMALSSILTLPAMVGVLGFGALVAVMKEVFDQLSMPKNLKDIARGIHTLAAMSDSLLKFEAMMALSVILAPVATIGFAMTTPLILGAFEILKRIGDIKNMKNVLQGTRALRDMSFSILAFSASLVLSTFMVKFLLTGGKDNIDYTSIISIATMLPVFGLMIGEYFLFKETIGKTQNAKNVQQGALALMLMGASTLVFAGTLLLTKMITDYIWKGSDGKVEWSDVWSVAGTLPVFVLMIGEYVLFKRAIGKEETLKDSAKGAASLALMGAGTLIYAVALKFAVDVTKDIWKGGDGKVDWMSVASTVGVFGLMFASTFLFKTAGSSMAEIAKGTLAMVLMGVGLVAFGFGMKLMVQPIEKVGIGLCFATMGLVLGYGLLFAAMGIPAVLGFIASGALAVAAMGVGLMSFGFGIGEYVKNVKTLGIKDLIKSAAILGAFGVEFGLLGFLGPQIAMAGVAITILGPGLTSFGWGMKNYIESMEGVDEERLSLMRKHIGLMGLEFGGLGLLGAQIALGGAAMTILGIGVMSFGASNKIYADSMKDLEKSQLALMREHIGLMGATFAGLGVLAVPMAAGAMAFQPVGPALKSIAKAMREWKDIGGVTDEDLDMLAKTVDRIKLVFLGNVDAEGKPQKSGGALGRVFKGVTGAIAAPFEFAQVATAAVALQAAGLSIRLLAKHITAWKDANIQESDLDSFSGIVTTLGTTFSTLAGNQEEDKSLMKKVFGLSFDVFKPTDVEIGIRTAHKMGKALKDIAKGVIEFRDGIGKEFSDPARAEELGVAIKNVLTPIGEAFAFFSDDTNLEKTSGGLVGKIMGTVFGGDPFSRVRSRIADGIEYTKGLGENLKNLAEGVKGFAELIPSNASDNWLGKVGDNIGAVLSALVGPLAAFGDEEENFEVAYNDLAKLGEKSAQVANSMGSMAQISTYKKGARFGVEAMRGLGQELVGIADALKTFSEISAKTLGEAGQFDPNTWTITNPGTGAIGGMQAVMVSIFGMFSELGKVIKETGTYTVLKNHSKGKGGMFTTGEVNDEYETNSYVGLAVSSLSGVGGVLRDIGESIAQFAKSDWAKNVTEGVNTAYTTLSDFVERFGGLGKYISEQGFYTTEDESGSLNMMKSAGEYMGDLIKTLNNKVFKPCVDNLDMMNNFQQMIGTYAEQVLNVNSVISLAAWKTTGNNIFSIYGVNGEKQYERNIYLSSFNDAITANGLRVDFLNSLKEVFNVANTISGNTDGMVSLVDGMRQMNECIEQMSALAPERVPMIDTSLSKLTSSLRSTVHSIGGVGFNSIDATRKLVNALIKADKANVFMNISKGTKATADALNSMEREKLKPLSEMLKALAEMSRRGSHYEDVFKKLIESLDALAKVLNGQKPEGGGGQGGDNGYNPPPESKPTTVVAKADVTIDATAFNNAVAAFQQAINNLPRQ